MLPKGKDLFFDYSTANLVPKKKGFIFRVEEVAGKNGGPVLGAMNALSGK